MSDDPRYAEGLVPERTDVWTNEWVPANAFTIRCLMPRGSGAKFSIGDLTGIVRQYLTDNGVEPHELEGFLANWGTHADLVNTGHGHVPGDRPPRY